MSDFGATASAQTARSANAAAAIQARKDSNLQAWQVINSAQGKGGSGGRADALHDLAKNGVSLAGVNVDGAWLEHVDLREASLQMASLMNANLHGALPQLVGAGAWQREAGDVAFDVGHDHRHTDTRKAFRQNHQ